MFDTFSKFAKALFGDANDRELKKLQPLVEKINTYEAAYEKLTDEQIPAKTDEFRERLKNGETLDDVLPEAFALVREAAKRTLGMRHYDCQMIGGIVLHQGKIAEMKTGEGKTLVGTLPTYLNAIEGKGAHLVTVNDYLAERDAEWMEPVYNFLGLTVGVILSGERNDAKKRAAYAADVTYGTNNEYGFDFLRDNMKFDTAQMVQRPHNFAIIDEVDSILIDEARTPLIISGPMDANIELYGIIDAIIPLLQNDVDFVVDEKGKSCSLTDEGISKVESKLGIDNLYDPHNMEVLHHLSQLLKAHYTFKRDRDYVVREGEVVIVDEFTGRLMAGRRWSDGLHQAVEAKEKVTVQKESQVYATITFQNLFRMYDKLAGMTGTAATEAAEFADIYDLDTMIIPTNKPIARADEEDVIYKTQMEKFRAVVANIKVRHAKGQPVLVGTTSVERSEIVHKLLERAEIPHEVLNAKNHSREALIIAQAGRSGSVTISTNMAGRGTDIKLGGNPEHMAADEIDVAIDPDGFNALHQRYITQCAVEEKDVLAAGGLYIIGTERHESRRVDNQLRGRAGRQGDAGGSRFYLSLEDDLMRIFGSDKITVWMERMGLEDDEPIEHRWITKAVENAQIKVEGHHFNSRKNLLEYDDVMNYQRKGVYAIRRRALDADGIVEMLESSVNNVVKDIIDDYMSDGVHPEHWNLEGVRVNLKRVFDVDWTESDEELRDRSLVDLQRRMLADGIGRLTAVKEEVGEETFIEFGRMLVLQYTDSLWKDHLLALDRLRQGVGLRGYGQRNPLLEYKREAFHMYQMMSAMRDEQVLRRLLSDVKEAADAAAQPKPRPAAPAPNGLAANPKTLAQVLGGAAPVASSAQPTPEAPPRPVARPPAGEETRVFAEQYGVKRNDPCPCGTGKKFKKCCHKAESRPSA